MPGLADAPWAQRTPWLRALLKCCLLLCSVRGWQNHGRPSNHLPELILNNFSTQLGHRVGRLLGSLFPQDPQFKGRRVVTLAQPEGLHLLPPPPVRGGPHPAILYTTVLYTTVLYITVLYITVL